MKRLLGSCVLFISLLSAVAIFGSGFGSTPPAGLTSGTTPISGGGTTQVCYNQAGVLKCGDSGLTYIEATDSLTISNGANATRLSVKSNASQTADLINAQDSAGDDLVEVLAAIGYTGGHIRVNCTAATCGPTSSATFGLDSNTNFAMQMGTGVSFFVDAGSSVLRVAPASPRISQFGDYFIDGFEDVIQLHVQGHSTQTSPLLTLEKSDGTDVFNVSNLGLAQPTLYGSLTNCSDSAGDAACTAAPAGSVVVDAADTTTVVSTTAVTANSQIFLQDDASLGTRLSVTCNTQALSVFNPRVTARTAGTSFTITLDAGPTTNPLCLSYFIVN